MHKDIPELTTLRFVAALAVVISHMHALGFVDLPDLFRFLDGGRPAVAFFFTLSGFVLGLRYQPANIDRRYYRARFARIYPVHILALLVSAPAVIYAGYVAPSSVEGLPADQSQVSIVLAASLVCQLLLLTAWTPMASLNQPWNGPTWSLSCEAFFYALFPRLTKRLSPLPVKILFLIVAGGWLLQLAWCIAIPALLPPNRAGFLLYQFPLPHLFEFVAGVVCAVLYSRGYLNGRPRLFYAVALAAIALVLALSWFQPAEPAYLLQGPVFAVLIFAIATCPGVPLLRARLGVLLGQSSYSFYVTHFPILMTLKVFALVAPAPFIIAALIAVSVIVFQYVEEPMRKALTRRPAIEAVAV